MNNQIQVELQESMGSDRAIANAAWTSSYDKQKRDQRDDESVKRVLTLLAEAKHSVPFESVIFRFWMRLPIATDRQLMTHRIASHSGLSGRYRTVPSDYLMITDDVNAILMKMLNSDVSNTTVIQDTISGYYDIANRSNKFYEHKIREFKEFMNKGIISNAEFKRLREFFRGVLPQHNMTERTSIFNLRSLANFIRLRLSKDAQPEIQQIAQMMLEQIKKANICPIAIEVLEKQNWNI